MHVDGVDEAEIVDEVEDCLKDARKRGEKHDPATKRLVKRILTRSAIPTAKIGVMSTLFGI